MRQKKENDQAEITPIEIKRNRQEYTPDRPDEATILACKKFMEACIERNSSATRSSVGSPVTAVITGFVDNRLHAVPVDSVNDFKNLAAPYYTTSRPRFLGNRSTSPTLECEMPSTGTDFATPGHN